MDAQRKLADLMDQFNFEEKRPDPENRTHKKPSAKQSTSESDEVSPL
jgi:hypothetical protein